MLPPSSSSLSSPMTIILLFLQISFLAILPHLTTATRAGLPYQPLNVPNIFNQRQPLRPLRSNQRRTPEGQLIHRGNQIAYAPTCRGQVVEPDFEPFDPSGALSYFDSTQKLCAATDFGGFTFPDGLSGNMGGACYQNLGTLRMDGPEARQPFFDMDPDCAHPILYQIVDLRHRCFETCECGPLSVGMKYLVIRDGQEQHRPVTDIAVHPIDGLDGVWARKNDIPVFISELASGNYRRSQQRGAATTKMTLQSTLAGGRPMRTWKDPPPEKGLAKDIFDDSCNRLQLTKGPLIMGVGASSLAACLGRRSLNEATDAEEEMGSEERKEDGEENRLDAEQE